MQELSFFGYHFWILKIIQFSIQLFNYLPLWKHLSRTSRQNISQRDYVTLHASKKRTPCKQFRNQNCRSCLSTFCHYILMMSFNYVFSKLVQFLFPFFPEHSQPQKRKTRRKGIQICLDMSKENNSCQSTGKRYYFKQITKNKSTTVSSLRTRSLTCTPLINYQIVSNNHPMISSYLLFCWV